LAKHLVRDLDSGPHSAQTYGGKELEPAIQEGRRAMTHPPATTDATMAAPPDPHQQGEDLRRFSRDVAYFADHREELLAQHPEQWVAIFDQQLVGVAPDPRGLLAALREQRVPAGRALIKHLTRENDVLIFPA
jgi:hypothetical protein